MSNSHYRKGRRAEHRAMAICAAAGFEASRAAGSKGAFDVIAWNGVQIRFLNIKSGTKYVSALEREQMQAVPVPPNATKEIWRFPDRCQQPLIEVISG